MANKASFSAEEWSRVVASPMVASTAITAAEPSGLWGLLQEGMAGGWALLKAKQDSTTNALVKTVVDDFANGDARAMAHERVQTVFKGAQPAELTQRAVDELRSVAIPRPRMIAGPLRAGSRRLHRKLPKQQRKVVSSG